jgi:hypothetical protein
VGDDRLDPPQGTLDLLIPKAVSLAPDVAWSVESAPC